MNPKLPRTARDWPEPRSRPTKKDDTLSTGTGSLALGILLALVIILVMPLMMR